MSDDLTLLTVYRRLGAVLFDEAARATGLAPGVLGARLRDELARPTLTAPTLRAWRRGSKAAPIAALLACCRIADLRPADVIALARNRTPDPASDDQGLRELLAQL